jgi:hypothetical protein
MNKLSKGGSLLTGALQFLKGKPTRSEAATVRKSSARMRVSQSTRAAPETAPSYRSAEIVCGNGACDSARELAGVRFLMSDIPRLPVQGCSVARCRCIYAHHTDRRNFADERRAQFSVQTKHYAIAIGEERRRKHGRREGEADGSMERYDFGNWDI